MSIHEVEQGIGQSWRHVADSVPHLQATLGSIDEALAKSFLFEGKFEQEHPVEEQNNNSRWL
jgi:hypothetical protein